MQYMHMYIYIYATLSESARLVFVVVKYCILAFSFASLNRKNLSVRPSIFFSTASIHEYAKRNTVFGPSRSQHRSKNKASEYCQHRLSRQHSPTHEHDDEFVLSWK